MKKIWVPQTLVCVMLVWAIYPENPYAYYILLRWVCCGVFVYLAFQASEQEKTNWVWILGITAVTYNPIFRVHLNREFWTVINMVTIIIALASIYYLSKNKDML